MSDLDKGFSHYWVLKREWDEMNKSARQLGHSNDEIRELHRTAHELSAASNNSHVDAFEVLLRVATPKAPDTFTPIAKGPSMISNLFFRFNQLITRWLYRDHKRQYKNLESGQDD